MSHLNWKEICVSPGYRSLKASYIKDVQENNRRKLRFGDKHPMRNKKELRKHFMDIIGLAMKKSNEWNLPFETVLNYWEADRGRLWWLGYYSNKRMFDKRKPSL